MRNSEKDYEFYLTQVGDSSNRSRWMLYVALVSSVLFFSISWNTLPGSLLQSRIEKRQQVSLYLRQKYQINKEGKPPYKFTQKELDEVKKSLEVLAGQEGKEDTDEFEQDQAAKLDSFEEKTKILSDGNNQRKGFFKMPFLDVQFDSNELGLFSSIYLTVVMVLFWYCLMRERNNLELVFRNSHADREFPKLFEKISMQQVLTVPPHVKGRGFLLWIQKSLFCFPLLTQVLIFGTDCVTFKVGMAINPVLFLTRFIVEFTGTLLIFLITIALVESSVDLDRTWTNYDPKIIPQPVGRKEGPRAKA